MGRLDNKVVVITGAGGGLGRSHALAFASEGAKIVVNDLGSTRDGSGADKSMAEKVVDEIRAAGGQAVANGDSVSTAEGAEGIIGAALKAFGRIDILINNAGILRDKTILKMTDDMWEVVLQVHLKGTFLCMQAAGRAMADQAQGGRIINTTSFAGLKGNFGQANYAAAKAGIYGLTLVGALEFSKHRITVNAIAPLAKTRLTEDVAVIPDHMKAEMVSPMVLFLASEEAAGITGRVFGVHGLQLFEYKMISTEGVKGETPWTLDAIRDAMPQIEGSSISAAPQAQPQAPSQAPPPAPTPAAPAPASAPSVETPADKAWAIFERMPAGFLPEKAGAWKGVLHWQIAGAGEFTVSVGDGKCATAKGLQGSPTCVVKTDADTFLGMVEGRVDGQQAYMQGKISATNISDLMKYKSSFSKEKAEAAAKGKTPQPSPATPPVAQSVKVAEPPAPQLDLPPEERVRWIFQLAPQLFPSEKVQGRETSIDFDLGPHGHWRLFWSKDGARSERDPKEGLAEGHVRAEAAALCDVLDGKADQAEAFREMRIVASPMADFLRFVGALAAQDHLKVIAKAVADCPVKVSGGLIKKTFHGSPLVIQPGHGEAYARATLEENPRYFRGKTDQLETPPLLAVRYHFDLAKTILTDPGLEVDLFRLLHGEQEIIFHHPLRPKDVISPKAALYDVEHKESGSLVTLRFALMREGVLANETFSRYFVRRPDSGTKKKKEQPIPEIDNPDFQATIDVRPDQSRLYAEASLDTNPVHVDESLAKAAGFKGLILHGLCTLAFASNAIVTHVAGEDPGRLASIKARFSKPVLMGDRLVTRGKVVESGKEWISVRFEVINQDNLPVITNGLATVKAKS